MEGVSQVQWTNPADLRPGDEVLINTGVSVRPETVEVIHAPTPYGPDQFILTTSTDGVRFARLVYHLAKVALVLRP